MSADVWVKKVIHHLPPALVREGLRRLRPHQFEVLQALRKKEGAYGLKSFDEKQCIFFHIPKCAGISMSQALFGHVGPGHRDAFWYRLVFSDAEFFSYWKFTVVRNPFDRILSAFLFLKNGGLSADDRCWADVHLAEFPDFGSFVKGWVTPRNCLSQLHFIPQYRFVCGFHDTLLVDFVARLETLDEDFKVISKKLEMDVSLPHSNRTPRASDYRSFYNDETRKIVADVYAKDLVLFGYNF